MLPSEEAELMTPDWEVGRNTLNYFYGVESSCSNYIQACELIQRLAAPAAETAQRDTTTAGSKALLAASPCLNPGHRSPSPGKLLQPLCSLPRAQFPSRQCSVPTFSREKKSQQSILISFFTDLTRVSSKSLLTTKSYFPNQKMVLFYKHILFLFQEQDGTAFKY